MKKFSIQELKTRVIAVVIGYLLGLYGPSQIVSTAIGIN